MDFLKPDKIVKARIGNNTIEIKQKIMADSFTAPKYVCSYVKKGEKMKPCAKLNDGSGKPKGITVHNTNDIKSAVGTNSAEQYSRATYNGNMNGVIVHFYVWDNEIWQLLSESERGWHAADGSSRRSSHRKGLTIGGNVDTIAIECIGNRSGSERTTEKLVAFLCKKHGLDPSIDIYTHQYFYNEKYCPQYILPHWSDFIENVVMYYNQDDKNDYKETENSNNNNMFVGGNEMTRGYFKKGDANEGVYMLKQCLMLLKQTGIISQGVDDNNIFGAGTLTAVKQVQSAAKIEQDGYAGPQTMSAIRKLLIKKI